MRWLAFYETNWQPRKIVLRNKAKPLLRNEFWKIERVADRMNGVSVLKETFCETKSQARSVFTKQSQSAFYETIWWLGSPDWLCSAKRDLVSGFSGLAECGNMRGAPGFASNDSGAPDNLPGAPNSLD
jgi:hypothetical protein